LLAYLDRTSLDEYSPFLEEDTLACLAASQPPPAEATEDPPTSPSGDCTEGVKTEGDLPEAMDEAPKK
jgi:hypothetical protein